MEKKTLIIIPTYNEKENILPLSQAIFKLTETLDIEILFIDDNSPDGTGELITNLSRQNPKIRAMHRNSKLGLGTAYIQGFRYALERGYDYIMEMDADFSHNPAYIPDFIQAIKDCDLVLGSRYIKGGGVKNWGILRRCISRGGSLYARTILRVGIQDLTGGFKCFKRETLLQIDLDAVYSNGYSFQIELTYRVLQKGLMVKEIPIIFDDRRVGRSKMSKKIFLEALYAVWKIKLS